MRWVKLKMSEPINILLKLLCGGIHGSPVNLSQYDTSAPETWQQVYDLSEQYGVAALVGEGIKHLPAEQRPPKIVLLQWLGQAMWQEKQSASQRQLVEELRQLWKQNAVMCIELKGMSVGRLYWKPELRYSCDFDCFLSDYEKGNAVIESAGVKVNRDFYKNSSFTWKSLYVENHQFCTPVRGNNAMKRLERKLRELLEGCQEYPSADFNALFLMEHAWAHFFEEALTLKQLCDWAVFRKACGSDVEWQLYEREAKACGFWRFSESMNRLADLLDGVRREDELECDDLRLLYDILDKRSISMNAGWRTRMQLMKNYFAQSWKYKAFSNHSMPYVLCRTIWGFVFDRKPEI